jgi:hypothetical protein
MPADAARASAAATGFTTNFVFTTEVMMVFLPLLVDQSLRLILHRAPDTIHGNATEVSNRWQTAGKDSQPDGSSYRSMPTNGI